MKNYDLLTKLIDLISSKNVFQKKLLSSFFGNCPVNELDEYENYLSNLIEFLQTRFNIDFQFIVNSYLNFI